MEIDRGTKEITFFYPTLITILTHNMWKFPRKIKSFFAAINSRVEKNDFKYPLYKTLK